MPGDPRILLSCPVIHSQTYNLPMCVGNKCDLKGRVIKLQLNVYKFIKCVAVHLGVMMADTLSFTAKVDVVDFWV